MASLPENDFYRRDFERTLAVLEGEIANVAAHSNWEPHIRAAYQRTIIRMAHDLRSRAERGQISWRAAAEQAHEARNITMDTLRHRSTAVGRSFAEAEKASGRALNELIGRYTIKRFGANARFDTLAIAQQEAIYADIVAAAARSNPRIDRFMRVSSRAGRGLIVLSIAISVYTIATSEDKVDATLHEGAVTAGGIGGGVAGGALAGLACGPGAPVCVTIGALVGGALVAFGIDWAWQ